MRRWVFAIAIGGAWACGGSNGDDGPADADTGSTAGADDVAPTSGDPTGDPDDTTGPDDASTGAPVGPTFAEDVAPILAEHCWSCHREGGMAPFSLVTFDDADAVGAVIPGMTASRLMPPWTLNGSGECHEFVDQRWLTDEEIATLADWVAAGKPPGDLSLAPPPPEDPPGLAEVSTTLALPLYTPQPDPPTHPFDDYRCFVVDPQLAADSVLTAFEVHPGVVEQAHHIVIWALQSQAAQDMAEAMDGADGAPGYPCFGGAGLGAGATIAGAWAPGVPVARFPEGTGAPVPGGLKLVVQMHYNVSAGAKPDATSIDVLFDDDATPLQQLIVADFNLSIPPGEAEHVEQHAMEIPTPVPLELVAVFPHMHEIGQTLIVTIDNGDGQACAVDVPRWDFHWQQLYSYTSPPIVQPGATVALQCTYDSTDRETTTTFGEGTSDEMCVALFFVRPML